jgi:hypothetical protein
MELANLFAISKNVSAGSDSSRFPVELVNLDHSSQSTAPVRLTKNQLKSCADIAASLAGMFERNT